jgi:hypothetical protein
MLRLTYANGDWIDFDNAADATPDEIAAILADGGKAEYLPDSEAYA